jgi:hypothetical protein
MEGKADIGSSAWLQIRGGTGLGTQPDTAALLNEERSIYLGHGMMLL